jgi:hypothetical protein
MADKTQQLPPETRNEIAASIVSAFRELQGQLSQSAVSSRRFNEVNDPNFIKAIAQYDQYYMALTWVGLSTFPPPSTGSL